jgi:hypothetical protein
MTTTFHVSRLPLHVMTVLPLDTTKPTLLKKKELKSNQKTKKKSPNLQICITIDHFRILCWLEAPIALVGAITVHMTIPDVWVTPSTWPSFAATSIGVQDNTNRVKLMGEGRCWWGTDPYLRYVVEAFGDCQQHTQAYSAISGRISHQRDRRWAVGLHHESSKLFHTALLCTAVC